MLHAGRQGRAHEHHAQKRARALRGRPSRRHHRGRKVARRALHLGLRRGQIDRRRGRGDDSRRRLRRNAARAGAGDKRLHAPRRAAARGTRAREALL